MRLNPSQPITIPCQPPGAVLVAKSANPQPGDVYVPSILQNMAIDWIKVNSSFLHRIFPALPVDQQTGYYTVWSLGDAARAQTEALAPMARPSGIGVGVDNTNMFSCKVYGAEFAISDQTLANWQIKPSSEAAAADLLGRAVATRRETDFAGQIFTTGVWGSDVTVATTWDDPSSDPIMDIEDQIDNIQASTGNKPNVMAMGYKVWKALKNHPDIVARITASTGGVEEPRKVTERAVAALFGLDEIIVGNAVVNSAAAGATNSIDYVVGKSALLIYRPSTPDLLMPSAGYMFSWQGLTGSADGIATRRGIDERAHQVWTQIFHAEQFKVTCSQLGAFFANCVA